MQRNFRFLTAGTLAGITLATCSLLAAPLWAQAPAAAPSTPAPAPAPAMVEIAPAKVLHQMLHQCQHEILPLVEAMPADKFDFTPSSLNLPGAQYQGVRTFAEQVKHLIQANNHMFASISTLPAPNPDMANLKTKEQIVQALKDSFEYGHQVIATITPENAFEAVGNGEGGPTRVGVVAFAVAHGFNHYGQLVEYLRMNGIVPPASRKGPPSKM